MPTKLQISALLALSLLVAPALALEEAYVESFDLEADARVSLENINGDVEIYGWDSAEVKVEYVKEAKTERGLERMKVDIDASGDHIHIKTRYLKSDRVFDWDEHGGAVSYKLWVPRQARLDGIELVNGRLDISDVEGELVAELVNGDVTAHGLRGDVEIETVNGAVEVTMEDLQTDRLVSIDSVNGSIELKVPSGIGAEIDASTVHGRISNDFGLDVSKGRYVGRSMKGAVNGGGARVELENVNGSIRVVAE